MALDRTQFIASFLVDAWEHVGEIDRCLLAWEKQTEGGRCMDGVFRAAHTLKGSSRMMRFPAISVTAHKMEDLFGALRDQRIVWSSRVGDLLLAGLDSIRGLLEQVANGVEVLEEDAALCLALEQLASGEWVPPVVTEAVIPTTEEPPASSPAHTVVVAQTVDNPPKRVAETATEEPKREVPVRSLAIRPIGRSGDATIRMDASQIDRLLQTVGESLTFRQRIKQRLQDVKKAQQLLTTGSHRTLSAKRVASLQAHLQQTMVQMREDVNLLDLVFDALHTHTLEMRLLPLSTLFDMFPRLVRDLAKVSGKQVELVVRGGETRLDRVIIEKLGDVFLHLLRNAMDHGIETPEARRMVGKPEQGLIHVLAGTQGGDVTIELRDDGGGIDLNKLQEAALKKNLVTAERLAQQSRSELIDLIFHPGLSTHAIITDLSGRGVGLDVVKKNIVEVLQGSIRVESDAQGTRFLMRLPLTLATVRVLLFRVSGVLFAMAGSAIAEVVRVAEEELISVVGGQAIRLREQVVPVLAMQSLLGLSVTDDPLLPKPHHTLLILSNRQEKRGLMCDGLVDEVVVVLKPLPYFMRQHPFASGMMVSGQNEIVLVLDGSLLWKRMMQVGSDRPQPVPVVRGKAREKQKHLLVVDDSRNTREIEQTILQTAGYQVSVAENGEEGYAKAIKQSFDLVVTDVEMPLLDGFSLTRKLRQHDRYRHTPIILVTSREASWSKRSPASWPNVSFTCLKRSKSIKIKTKSLPVRCAVVIAWVNRS
ncbi:MAG: hybrid sensor histidine kinase/response regulator [Magnetococcales bacterium]|nr:hybrid sensor histidine kinase/response regulator [Magnetococcales bacterium]